MRQITIMGGYDIMKKIYIDKNDEKMILISLVGILELLKNKKILIDEAEKYCFSPYMINKLKAIKCNDKIIDILEKGCELEDIASLIPDQLLKVIDELEQEVLELIKEYPIVDEEFWELG